MTQTATDFTRNVNGPPAAPILTRPVLWHVANILKAEMALDSSRVYLFNQKYLLPTDEGLLIAVGMESGKAFGSTNRLDSSGNEVQSVAMSAMLWIDLVSRDPSALDLKEDVLLALNSIFSQQTQEKFGFHIGRLPPVPMVNLSEIEGASIPFRFKIMVQVQYLVKKTKAANYYTTFAESITTER